jgi:hypothetical protein
MEIAGRLSETGMAKWKSPLSGRGPICPESLARGTYIEGLTSLPHSIECVSAVHTS